MSNGSTYPPHRRLRGALLAVLTTVVVAGLGGWLLWRTSGGDGGPAHGAGPPAASRSPGSGAAGASGPGGTGRDPGKGASHGSLKGKVVLLDPGHNPHNRDHGREIARQVDIGNARKECDTTGTSTDDGYAEASFTLDVAHRVRTLLQEEGAKVVFTQDGDHRYGPCVDERAAVGNKAHADAALSLHADGSAPGNRGFHVILPARVTAGPADTAAIVAPSRRLGERLAGRFRAVTGSAPSNYIGHGTGLDVRSDLGGLNLSTVPKVFIECGNMRDPKDAAELTDAHWRQKAARGITEGITDFLTH
ncbi:N-acetylmuramoyl-L-alanine amidase [Streptomyces sioyaensis]|uniref:N-acetylmuramoyl-L-alanine amidase n=1 Tax=Streptomyces sioyaensis TaxID=67364 RepID=A0A4Q1R0E9_9ACTN|nr:N-acetylmuramoyl-L-alanine amidase [Streptomyces sioyaensis]MBM4796420.1 N-acetylmuramoyl-L-alanine amidase [Streptomyces sioyaensis]RXS64269.1 N-acetylmuramoyl-L-alanine amidase [Streptomyces sioyaensis]